MGGQMQQSNAAAAAATTALYDHAGAGGSGGSDAGSDAVMARWLQSAGLQHLASPLASTGIDHRLLPNLLMQVSNPIFFDWGLWFSLFIPICLVNWSINLKIEFGWSF